TLTRIVTCTSRRDNIMPILVDLHWLPVVTRIDYKIALLTFKAMTTDQPGYLRELLQITRPTRLLRSNGHINRLHDNVARTVFASRAFRHAAPAVWNALPLDITIIVTIITLNIHYLEEG